MSLADSAISDAPHIKESVDSVIVRCFFRMIHHLSA